MAPIAISPERDGQLDSLASLTAKFDDTLRFYLNGTKVVLDEIDPEITVLEYLRGIGLTGTKLYEAPFHFCAYTTTTHPFPIVTDTHQTAAVARVDAAPAPSL